MMEVLLIRHGETAWNVEKRLQGHIDIPLNAVGQQQAVALGQALAHEALDAIFTSDLQRARVTAQAVAQLQTRTMQVQVDPALRERCYGGFEGLQPRDIEQRYPLDFAAWRARELDVRYPPGERVAETLREFSTRVIDVAIRVMNGGNYRKIAIVTHGGVLECLYRWATGTGWGQARNFDIFNAGINRLLWDGQHMHLKQWGDVAHLTEHVLDEVDR